MTNEIDYQSEIFRLRQEVSKKRLCLKRMEQKSLMTSLNPYVEEAAYTTGFPSAYSFEYLILEPRKGPITYSVRISNRFNFYIDRLMMNLMTASDQKLILVPDNGPAPVFMKMAKPNNMAVISQEFIHWRHFRSNGENPYMFESPIDVPKRSNFLITFMNSSNEYFKVNLVLMGLHKR